jgi:hypothetical protein
MTGRCVPLKIGPWTDDWARLGQTGTTRTETISKLGLRKIWHFDKIGFWQTWEFGHQTSPLVPELLGKTPCSCL